jgi:hypothetical protein
LQAAVATFITLGRWSKFCAGHITSLDVKHAFQVSNFITTDEWFMPCKVSKQA